ncbi:MAG TPA: DUF1501 domain-containing protein [Saprospiraceae bacterium]|nr:DUF1501 domain-containing protein [Saprospiraceae bacterium]HNT19702.1 DUF1501 domain-containing protein [Saprospiraceae bacterium]
MHQCNHYRRAHSRREFLAKTALGLGSFAFAGLLDPQSFKANNPFKRTADSLRGLPHFTPRVKRVIYLFQSGAPSQVDLFDHKPQLMKYQGQDLPASIRGTQRQTGMSAGQKIFPVVPSPYSFKASGRSGTLFSEMLPYTAQVADELTIIRSMYTEAINHDPAATFVQTGSQQPGRPSIGSWVSYGLGGENENLPAFIVLLSRNTSSGQPLYDRLWGNGFLPSQHQGVKFRAGKDPVLYLDNPAGMDGTDRRRQLDYLNELQKVQQQQVQDPEIEAKIAQYEMAFRMQTSVPEALDLKGEPDYIFDLYGPDSRKPGTFAANCLLARRLAERNVRFIQLYHQDWDHHGGLPQAMPDVCRATDQPSAALVRDLKQRGLLEDTLVIWGGEFGRTTYSQGKVTAETFGRDHHPGCYSIWMAGGGLKKGFSYGSTDDFCFNVAENGVHIHDFQATLMHLLGIDHEKLNYKYEGRRFRLTDVHGKVVHDILS